MSNPIPAQMRQREAELLDTIKANKLEPCMRAMTELLQDRLDRANATFRTCTPDEFLGLQARAHVFATLLAEINT